MAKEITVLYYTDNSLSEDIYSKCRKYLLLAAGGCPVVSVSQLPVDIGRNVCVGNIGRSFLSLYKQLAEGLRAVETEYVALAEHDVLYPIGYFDWIPPRDDTFYYSGNTIWSVHKKGVQYGMYMTSATQHPSLESLICNKNLLSIAIGKRISLLEKPTQPRPAGWGEPGFAYDDEQYEMRFLGIPIIDIRHNDNYTMRTGNFEKTFWVAEGWGRYDSIILSLHARSK